MLRIHFTDADLARTTLATAPDPFWEITASLHRLQTRRGRAAHAEWYRMARRRLREDGLERAVRDVLLPLYPRAGYFPDFLTPEHVVDRFGDGEEAILATPPGRVRREVARLDRTVGAPPWAPALARSQARRELLRLLRAYHDSVVAPYADRMHARIEAERASCCRTVLDGGVVGMLAALGPTMRWRPPVLEVAYPAEDRDLHLDGRGLALVPSYFAADAPVSFADPRLRPVLWYPLDHGGPAVQAVPPGAAHGDLAGQRLSALLGRARATALAVAATGATTGEIARAAGVSAPSASRHAAALRDAGLLTSVRNGPSVLHTLTPAGATLLGAPVRTPGAPPPSRR